MTRIRSWVTTASVLLGTALAVAQGNSGTWEVFANVPTVRCETGPGGTLIDFSAPVVDTRVAVKPDSVVTEPFGTELLDTSPPEKPATRIISGIVTSKLQCPWNNSDSAALNCVSGFSMILFSTGSELWIPATALRGYRERRAASSEEKFVNAEAVRCRVRIGLSRSWSVNLFLNDGRSLAGKVLFAGPTNFDFGVQTPREVAPDDTNPEHQGWVVLNAWTGPPELETNKVSERLTIAYRDVQRVEDATSSARAGASKRKKSPWETSKPWLAELIVAVRRDVPESDAFSPDMPTPASQQDLPNRTVSGIVACWGGSAWDLTRFDNFYLLQLPSRKPMRIPFNAVRAYRQRAMTPAEAPFVKIGETYCQVRNCTDAGPYKLLLNNGKQYRGRVSAVRDEDFEFELEKTGAKLTFRYSEVKQIRGVTEWWRYIPLPSA